MSSVITLNGKIYSYALIQEGAFDSSNTPFEKATLEFCHDWLTGKNAFTISTSGSTGTPKSITHSRTQMETSARQSAKALGLEKGDQALLCLDPRYIAGMMMLVRSFVTGMSVFAVEPVANPMTSVPPSQRIDFAAFVPYQLEAILNADDGLHRLSQFRVIIVGGAAPDERLVKRLQSLPCRVYLTYGMTETISHVALRQLNGADHDDYFHVLPGINMGLDERGCLTIQSDYLGEATIVTNDIVDLKSQSSFEWIGRADDVINSGGIKIFPNEVEKRIHGALDAVGAIHWFIAGVPDQVLGQKVILVLEGAAISPDRHDHLLSQLSKLLPKYQVPKTIYHVAKFHMTPTNKIDRRSTIQMLK